MIIRSTIQDMLRLDSELGNKAISEYAEEVILEPVNFQLCTDLWNECILIVTNEQIQEPLLQKSSDDVEYEEEEFI